MDALSNLLDHPPTVDPPQQPHFIVICDQRLCLLPVDSKAMAARVLLIVVPLEERAPAAITDPNLHWRLRVNVKHGPTGPANPSAGKPSDQIVLRHLYADDPI
jgi:hypothetical protein